MKLKYYLRGIGTGMIVTTLLLAFSFSHREAEISDEEVMERAAALGMVMAETEETETKEPGSEEPGTELPPETEEPETEEPGTELPADDVGEPAMESYQLVIEEGDVCETVCDKLEEDGVIGDAWELQVYMDEAGYAKNIQIGSYEIPYGLTVEEVGEMIASGPTR